MAPPAIDSSVGAIESIIKLVVITDSRPQYFA